MNEAILSTKQMEKPGWLGPVFFWELMSSDVVTELTFIDPQYAAMQTQIVVREPKEPNQALTVREHRSERWLQIPPIIDYPLLWKEMRFPLSDFGIVVTVLCCGYPLFLLMAGISEALSGIRDAGFKGPLFWAVRADMMILLIMVTFRAPARLAKSDCNKH